MSELIKFDVFEYETGDGFRTLFSKGVNREFGENKVVYTGDYQFLSSVMPCHDSNGLKKVGYIKAKGDNQ